MYSKNHADLFIYFNIDILPMLGKELTITNVVLGPSTTCLRPKPGKGCYTFYCLYKIHNTSCNTV